MIDLGREAIMFSPISWLGVWNLETTYVVSRGPSLLCSHWFLPKNKHTHKSAVLTELKLSLTSAAGSMEGFQWLLIYDGLNVG